MGDGAARAATERAAVVGEVRERVFHHGVGCVGAAAGGGIWREGEVGVELWWDLGWCRCWYWDDVG